MSDSIKVTIEDCHGKKIAEIILSSIEDRVVWRNPHILATELGHVIVERHRPSTGPTEWVEDRLIEDGFSKVAFTSEDTLKQFGTISLGIEFMKQTIKFGELVFDEVNTGRIDHELNPHALCLDLWIAFVPLPFREAAAHHMIKIAGEYVRFIASQQTMINEIISKFQNQMLLAALERKLDSSGWKL